MQWFSIGGTEQPRTFPVLKRTKAQLLTKKTSSKKARKEESTKRKNRNQINTYKIDLK